MEAMIAVFSKVARYGWRFVFWGSHLAVEFFSSEKKSGATMRSALLISGFLFLSELS
jgi:hypothetical protein